jgi:hypothetical protein
VLRIGMAVLHVASQTECRAAACQKTTSLQTAKRPVCTTKNSRLASCLPEDSISPDCQKKPICLIKVKGKLLLCCGVLCCAVLFSCSICCVLCLCCVFCCCCCC